MFYNTTNEKGSELSTSKERSVIQTVLVLNVFKLFPNDNLSPDEGTKYIANTFNRTFPITSIRRAITDLTSEGKLKKTDKKVMGHWGKRVRTWILKNK